MRQRHADVAGIEWQWVDIRDILEAVPTASIDVAFDKSTLDAMIHGSPEVYHALKEDGVFLYITYRQPHFMRPLLNADNLWVMDMDVLSDDDSAFDHYGFVLRKNNVHAGP
ncbi:hypothetical protein BDP55DRAFT_731684 [Colletotrichum godetiae]|uniref:Methyltransferase type 11 domain-containing protein n=1 Tax=Colletotrichum godetiae TaxID=1209918 RepID=A0AAJ0EUG3_9PEZI|nr:uncharacterized protein BDP55DRAFT_731684 [Colletotrichum godetiae]KAK1672235.1 hypothetical protein BDP55DRAFT_731684 [Colletotrichum godetiae]